MAAFYKTLTFSILILVSLITQSLTKDTCECSKKSYNECGLDSNSRSGCHWVRYPYQTFCGVKVDEKPSECCETRNYRRCLRRNEDGTKICEDFDESIDNEKKCNEEIGKLSFLE